MCSRLCATLVMILILPGIRAIQPFNGDTLPSNISEKLDDYWRTYKTQFNKTYTRNLENVRRAAWEQNLVEIYKHNLLAAAGHHSYTLRDNHIADLSTRQYMREMVKLMPSRRRRLPTEPIVSAVLKNPRDIPARLDWREYGFVTSPVNQRSCGSCYAYSIAESIEGQIFKQTGMLLPLSAQQLVDCSTSTGNLGCTGGSLRNTLKYLEKSKGLMARSTYPYNAEKCQKICEDFGEENPNYASHVNVINFRNMNGSVTMTLPAPLLIQGECQFQKDLSVVNITSWAILPARDEKALEIAVATIGPIAASINASPKTFQLYHKGVYDDHQCSSDMVNHAMLVVGYTPTEWILKNWWGASWGEKGYMRLARNKNRCGVANYAAYVKV